MLNGSVPEWVESHGKPIDGLDLLGLRLPVQVISGSLLNGITTISPRVRFLSIRSWIIKAFSESGLPNETSSLSDFSGRVEAAIALATLLVDYKVLYIPGSEKAKKIIDEGVDPVPIEKLIDQTAFNAYAGPSYGLFLSFTNDNGVSGLTKERGEPLASEFESLIKGTRFFTLLKENPAFNSVSRAILEEFGHAIKLEHITDAERELLLNAVIPTAPYNKAKLPLRKEINRISVYTLLLELASSLNRLPVEVDIFDVALNTMSNMPEVLMSIRDGYLWYLIRDILSVTHEAVLGEVCSELGGYEEGVPSAKIIQELLSDHINEALQHVGLLKEEESFERIRYRELLERIKSKIGELQYECGINRWSSELDETAMIEYIIRNKYAAVGLQPVTWILCQLRVGSCDINQHPQLEILSRQGHARLGLQQVVLSQLECWHESNPTLDQVISWQLQRTVDQHLKIAWSRMFSDVNKDVAILVSDGDQWARRNKDYIGGRTASRISQAIGWLKQLGLIDDNGLTPAGKTVLKQGYQTLMKYGGEI